MDVVFGAIIAGGGDPWNSAQKKIGGGADTTKLTIDQQAEYIQTFVGTINMHSGLHGIVLHDCLAPELIERLQTDRLKFERVPTPPNADNYEGRFYAFRNYLTTHAEIQRVWFIDVSDVAFQVDPFAWWSKLAPAEDAVLVGEEWVKYNGNPWFGHQLAHLPPQYGEVILDTNGDTFPLNIGVWGATRLTALGVLNRLCENFITIKQHFAQKPPPFNIMVDMFAFGYVLLKYYPTRLIPFKMCPNQVRYGLNSPVIHDRPRALKCIEGAVGVGELKLPPELLNSVRFTYSLEGWCPPEKAEAMAALVVAVRPKLLLEIGVFGGRSLLPQALALKYVGSGVIYGIDPWTTTAALEGGCDDEKWWKEADMAGYYSRFMITTGALGLWPHVRVLAAPSEKVYEVFQPDSIDILHIDGNHSEAVSSRDVHLYLSRVRIGGYVWFDDSDWSSTKKAIQMVDERCDLVKDYKSYRLYKRVR